MAEVSIEFIYTAIAVAGFLCGILLVALLWWRQSSKQAALYEELQKTRGEQEIELQHRQSRIEYLQIFQSDVAAKEHSLFELNRENAGLKAQMQQQQNHYQEQLGLLKEAREQLTKDFENIANKIFDAKQLHFKQQSQQTLEGTLNPLRDQLKDFRKQVEDVYSKENADRNKLMGQITELQKQTQQIGNDAVNLAQALKGSNKTQGNWGEIILERLLEESGLKKGREYETQVSLKSESGQRRNPDVIIRLPENKDIIVDAKVSLLDYEQYCNSEDEIDRQQYLSKHVSSMKAHIDSLNKKDYEKLENIRSLDFVFIFIPIEAAFMVAHEYDPGLFQYAYDKHIILVSPTTLLATLRTVENIWRYEKQNRNAEKIASMAGGLHDQFALVIESLEEVGANIDKTQNSYNKVQQRLRYGKGNLVKRVKDLEVLGAKTKKTISARDEDVLEMDTEGRSEESSKLVSSKREKVLELDPES